jgi:hypothetical protein
MYIVLLLGFQNEPNIRYIGIVNGFMTLKFVNKAPYETPRGFETHLAPPSTTRLAPVI